MRYLFILNIFTFLVFSSCKPDVQSTDTDQTDTVGEVPKEEEVKVIKLPVEIYPSTVKDYPEDLISLGFPVHPKVAVENVGSTRIHDEGMLIQLNTYEKQDAILDYYKTEMKSLGWTEGKLNIYKGASKAVKFDKDGLTCRMLFISDDDLDYRKIAVNVTKALNPADYQ